MPHAVVVALEMGTLIAIGVCLLVLLLIVSVYLLWKRRRRGGSVIFVGLLNVLVALFLAWEPIVSGHTTGREVLVIAAFLGLGLLLLWRGLRGR